MNYILDGKINTPILSEIGGKAKGLLFLEQNNFLTPHFYIIPFDVLADIFSGKITIEVILQNWISKNKIKEDQIWAVRSSAENEDGEKRSFAGFFTSKINVKTNNIKEAINEVVLSYSRLKENTRFGVIIQQMIRSEYSGVIFSHNPFNVNDNTIHINVIPGIGENLVSDKEEAFSITYANKNYSFLNADGHFRGQYYSDSLIDLEKSGEEIKKEIDPFLSELVNGTKKLQQLKKHPVDIEFTIASGIVYWLQVRPITTGNNETIIWDNTAAEGNYPGITLPLSISMVSNSFYKAYKGMALFLKMPKEQVVKNENLLKNMSGQINGTIYYNVTAWQKLIYQLPFGKKASAALPKMWGMKETAFVPEPHGKSTFTKTLLFLKLLTSFFFFKKLKKSYIKNFDDVFSQYEKTDIQGKDQKELFGIYTTIENRLGDNWAAPMLNGFFTILFFSALKSCVTRSRLISKYPNFVNDILFSQGDIISVLILQEFQVIVKQLQDNQTITELFKNNEPNEIVMKLKNEHPDFYVKIEKYILDYGERSDEGELKMETVNYKEDPLLLFSLLKTYTDIKINVNRQKISFNYRRVLKQEYRYNFIKRGIFNFLVTQSIKRIRDRENFKFMRTRAFDLVRQIFRAVDNELLSKKLINEKDDSMYLLLSELTDISKRNNYVAIIDERKENYKKYNNIEKVNRYVQLNDRYTADEEQEILTDNFTVSGTGCCSGIVKGECIIITDQPIDVKKLAGKILISNYFEPGKLNILSEVGGLISVRGNLLSHTAIICREMGIPSIVGAKGLLAKIKEGDLIEMNGSTGKIKLFSGNE